MIYVELGVEVGIGVEVGGTVDIDVYVKEGGKESSIMIPPL